MQGKPKLQPRFTGTKPYSETDSDPDQNYAKLNQIKKISNQSNLDNI